MARNTIKARKHETGRLITTKTPYGTTNDMVVTDEEILSKVKLPENSILAKDDSGYYITLKNRVDNRLADPNRYDIAHRERIEAKIMEDINAK